MKIILDLEFGSENQKQIILQFHLAHLAVLKQNADMQHKGNKFDVYIGDDAVTQLVTHKQIVELLKSYD